jgi:hypothetical protein
MAKFQGAARGRGFAPVQVSAANISRMREENERILRGMRERRESQRNNEERILRQMKEDAAYGEKARRRDFEIADTNVSNEARQAQYNEAVRQKEYAQSTQAVESVVDSIVKFSATAQKAADLARAEKEQKEIEEGILWRKTNGPINPAQLKWNAGEAIEQEAIEEVSGNLKVAQAEGAPENEIAKARYLTQHQSLGALQEDARQKALTKYTSYRTNYFQENPDALANSTTASEALNAVTLGFLKEEGLDQYPPELLGKALDEMERLDRTFRSGIIDRETKNANTQVITTVTNQALSDWKMYGSSSFRRVLEIKGADAAHAWLKKMATAMDDKGNFLLKDNEWQNTDVRGDGNLYYTGERNQGFYRRSVEILNAREDKRREWRRNSDTDDRLSHNEESKAWARHIIKEGNNTPGDIAAAKKSFENNPLGEPEWLRKLTNAGKEGQGQYNSDLIARAKDLEARGMLYPEIIEKVNERDPKVANELQASYEKQDPFMRDDLYKQYYESIDKLPLVQNMGTGNYPDPHGDAIKATAALQDAYKELVKRAVADGASIKDAGYSAIKAIESGFNDPNSPFHRVFNPNTAQYEFRKLYTKTPKEIAESLDQADSDFLERLDSGKIQDVFSDPDMILTDAQFDANVASMSRPGYTFPARVEMLVQTGHLKGSHMEIMQQIATLKGKPAIQPPPSLQTVSNYPPKANQLLALWGPRSSNIEARAHGAGMQAQATGAGLALVPETAIPNLRELYRTSAERHGVSPAENAAIGEIESAHGLGYPDPKTKRSYIGGRKAAFGPLQILPGAHPEFFEKHNGNPSDEAVIDYGTAYYAGLKREFNGDHIAAAMSYNGGKKHYLLWLRGDTPEWVKNDTDMIEWLGIVDQMVNYGKKFAKAYYKHSGDASLLQNPLLLRN